MPNILFLLGSALTFIWWMLRKYTKGDNFNYNDNETFLSENNNDNNKSKNDEDENVIFYQK